MIKEKVKRTMPAGRQERSDCVFGPHLMINCYGCPRERLSDAALVFDTLESFPEKLGMIKLMPPYVFKYHGSSPDEWGVSGVVLIAESHITIHTFPDKQHAFIDIFSGHDFDTGKAADYMVELFGAASHDAELLSRGAGLPAGLPLVTEIVESERNVVFERPRLYN